MKEVLMHRVPIEALQKAAKSDENFIIRQEAGKALDSVKSRSS